MIDPRIEIVQRFFSGTGPTYDFLVKLNTFGMDNYWKRQILTKIPKEPVCILDQGCGTGILTFRIARRFPRCRVIGVELREEYLDIAKENGRALGISNVEFILGRAEDIILDSDMDCITSSYLAKYADLEVLARNIRQMLRKGGLLIMHDFTYPPNRRFARIWEIYLRLLQTWGAWKYPGWREIYYGLPVLLRTTQWVPELTGILGRGGFSEIRRQSLTFGTSLIVTARKI